MTDSGITAVRTGSGTAYGFELSSDQHSTNTLYLGSTAQNPTWRQFDPYGNPRGTAPATGFPGSRRLLNDPVDTSTGLTNIGARWYDPATGAFASLDPVLYTASPQQLNGYTYAGANPAGSSDPTGLYPTGGCDASETCTPAPPPPHPTGDAGSQQQTTSVVFGPGLAVGPQATVRKDVIKTIAWFNGRGLADDRVCGTCAAGRARMRGGAAVR